jgi:hypothetical protein
MVNFLLSLRGKFRDRRERDLTKQSLRDRREIASQNKPPFGRFILLAMTIMALFSSCSTVTESTFSPQIVVQGYLYANEPLDSIVLRQTIPIGSSTGNDFVSGAVVTISSGDSIYTLHERMPFEPGRYTSDHTVIIQPGTTYTLRVEAFGQIATATTTVPLAIHLDSAEVDGRKLSLSATDSITYPTIVDSLQSQGIHLWWSPSPGSAGYGVEALCTDTSARTNPITGIDSGGRIQDLPATFSDSLAFGRYRFFILSTNEQIVWYQFLYYGPNVVRALALDKNYQDFILALYLSGSQFDNSTLDVTGGLGVFGSAARASKYVYLK